MNRHHALEPQDRVVENFTAGVEDADALRICLAMRRDEGGDGTVRVGGATTRRRNFVDIRARRGTRWNGSAATTWTTWASPKIALK